MVTRASEMSLLEERRRRPRFSVTGAVALKVNGETHVAKCGNLSEDGLGVLVPRTFAIDQPVFLVLNENSGLSLPLQVVWVASQGVGHPVAVGIRLEGDAESKRKAIHVLSSCLVANWGAWGELPMRTPVVGGSRNLDRLEVRNPNPEPFVDRCERRLEARPCALSDR